MRRPAGERVQLGENLNPLNDPSGADSIDFSADIDDLIRKVGKLRALYEKGEVDSDILRYVPGMNKIMYHGQINYIDMKRSYAASTYTEMEQMEFIIELTADHYLNFSNIELCLPITFRKKTNKANAIDGDMIPVNNFFTQWIKDVDVKRYGDEIAVLPTNKTVGIYRYSESMLKHLPAKALATFQKNLLYSKKPVVIKGNAANTINDRRNHIAAAARNSNTDDNLQDRIAKFNAETRYLKKKCTEFRLNI